MCLIAFAWQSHPRYRLLLAANRDERHDRPADAMDWWSDEPDLLAGRDRQAGGTWLAISRRGRFATVTNYREHVEKAPDLLSRGSLVTDFVNANASTQKFLASVSGDRYAGFSMLACDGNELWYASNRGENTVRLSAGVYGLSNASLDTPWFKLVRTRERLRDMIADDRVDESSLLELLDDRRPAPADRSDALPFDLASAERAPFIVGDDYGTRCTTAVTWSVAGEIAVAEARFGPGGVADGQSNFRFSIGDR